MRLGSGLWAEWSSTPALTPSVSQTMTASSPCRSTVYGLLPTSRRSLKGVQLKLWPQPQVRCALGLSMENPASVRPSL